MKSFFTASLFITAAFGAVVPRESNLYKACEKASNCEVYTGPSGRSVRFKSGMEPGSESYNSTIAKRAALMKRDDLTTYISQGQKIMKWGVTSPSTIADQLDDRCGNGACANQPYT